MKLSASQVRVTRTIRNGNDVIKSVRTLDALAKKGFTTRVRADWGKYVLALTPQGLEQLVVNSETSELTTAAELKIAAEYEKFSTQELYARAKELFAENTDELNSLIEYIKSFPDTDNGWGSWNTSPPTVR